MFTGILPRTRYALASSSSVAVPSPIAPLPLQILGHTLHYISTTFLTQQCGTSLNTPIGVDEWAQLCGVDGPTLSKWRWAVARHNATLALQGSLGDDHGAFLRHGVREMGLIVSPFVTLASLSNLGVELVARRPMEPGAFVLSVPLGVMLVANLPPLPAMEGQSAETRQLERYIATVEDLAATLLAALSSPDDPLHRYATFLRGIPPPKNMPYLRPGTTQLQSDGWGALLRSAFERELKHPMCPALRGVDEANLRWAFSTVLSRRITTDLMVPFVDYLNHSAAPNVYYSMPAVPAGLMGRAAVDDDAGDYSSGVAKSLTGINVLDNLLAGVPSERIEQPYLHVYAICRIRAGEPLVLSYSDADPQTAEGRDVWLSQWGFVPERRAEVSSAELLQAAGVVARRTVLGRRQLFPADSSS